MTDLSWSSIDPTYYGVRLLADILFPWVSSMTKITDEQYRILLTFRCALRQFLAWSQEQAALVGLTAQQHQLLLAVRAHAGPNHPSIRDVSEYLLIRHHSAVELVGRVTSMGLVARHPDPTDQRVVRLVLTPHGESLLEKLSGTHLEELQRVASTLHISEQFLDRLSQDFLGESSEQPA